MSKYKIIEDNGDWYFGSLKKRYKFVNVYHEDISHFINFINFLQEGKVKIVFRGEGRVNDIYKIDISNIEESSAKIFMFGAKGEYFWKQRNKLFKRPIDINFVTKLFNAFIKVFTMGAKNLRTQKRIDRFRSGNKDFVKFFLDLDNSKFMLRELLLLQNDEFQDTLLEYYFTILHCIGKPFNCGSIQLSSTTALSTAKRFANKGIIYVAWISPDESFHHSIMGNSYKSEIDEKLRQIGLPIVKDLSMYPEQKEISFKYGILPHFMLGYIYNGLFVINPHFYKGHMNFDDMYEEGFDIDQTNFDKEQCLTRFKRTFNSISGYRYSFDLLCKNILK